MSRYGFCEVCGEYVGDKRRFGAYTCSNKCRQKAYRQRKKKSVTVEDHNRNASK